LVERVAFGEPPPGLQQTARGSGIVPGPAQIPGVAQRRLVLGAPGVARPCRGVGERQALTPEAIDRVIVAGDPVARGERQVLAPETTDRVILVGDRVQGGERGAGGKARFFGGFRRAAHGGPSPETGEMSGGHRG